MTARAQCEALDRLQSEAAAAASEAKKTRRLRDVSIQEDATLSREVQRHIDALIKHLLVGHNGQPCPAGERPIIRANCPATGPEDHSRIIRELVHTGKN